jgi:hypothetical protein
MIKFVNWKNNLALLEARRLILINLNREGYVRSMKQ